MSSRQCENLRMDLLGEDAGGNLHHLELQSTNDSGIGLRMEKGAQQTYQRTGKYPHQVVLYVGEEPLTMASGAHYTVVDIRDLDGEDLLASESIGDNILALLTRLRDYGEAIRMILSRIAAMPADERSATLEQLVTLSGLRRLELTVKEEVEKVPILKDILEHKIIGGAVRDGEQRLLTHLIEKRFGPLPDWANTKLAGLSIPEIEAISDRIFDAANLEDLLR